MGCQARGTYSGAVEERNLTRLHHLHRGLTSEASKSVAERCRIERRACPVLLLRPHPVVHRHRDSRRHLPDQERGLVGAHVAADTVDRDEHDADPLLPHRTQAGVVLAIADVPEAHASHVEQEAHGITGHSDLLIVAGEGRRHLDIAEPMTAPTVESYRSLRRPAPDLRPYDTRCRTPE